MQHAEAEACGPAAADTTPTLNAAGPNGDGGDAAPASTHLLDATDADAPRALLDRAFPADGDTAARPCLIDLRDASAFMKSRLRGSFSVPLKVLVPRMFILPDRATPLGLIVGGPPAQQTVQGAAAGGGSKQEVEVSSFLSSRGWRVAFCAEASPQLWRAAEELGLLEVGGEPLALQRRWPFHPSKLLMQQAPLVEEMLVRSWMQRQQQQDGEAGAGAGAASAGAGAASSSDQCMTLRMLDVGCGSGRDLAWLSTRESSVVVPPTAAAGGSGGGEVGGVGGGAGRAREVRVSWECVGLDSWHGALERAAEVLDLGAVPAGPGGVTLHLVQIGGAAAAAATTGAAAAPAAAGDGEAGGAGASGSGSCALKTLSPPGVGGGSDGGAGEGVGGKGSGGGKKAKKGGKGTEVMLRYLAGAGVGGGGAGSVREAKAPPAVAVLTAAEPPGLGAAETTGAATSTAPAAAPIPSCTSAPELGTFDLLVCVRFLERSFLPHMVRLLRPGGVILYSTFVDGPGLRAFGRPTGREHVLQRDELAGCMFGPGQGFEVLRDDLDVTADGREVSMFAARKVA